jgi:hypothetical protein
VSGGAVPLGRELVADFDCGVWVGKPVKVRASLASGALSGEAAEEWRYYLAMEGAPLPSETDGTIIINGGAVYVFDLDVTLGIDHGTVGGDEMQLKNEGDAGWGAWQAYATTLPWTLLDGGPGIRKVWVRFRTGGGTATTATSATTEYMRRAPMGGNGVDVLDATWNIDRKGGFTSADVDVVPPKSTARFADAVNEGIEIRDTNQHLLWEGRVEEPDLAYREADKLTIAATGYGGLLDDDEYFRRLYADGGIDSWQLDQSNQFADRFNVEIENDGNLVLKVAASSAADYPTLLDTGMNCRAYWQLFGGIPTNQSVTGVKFHYVSQLSGLLRVRLYARDALTGWSFNRVAWTSPELASDEDDVSLSAVDIGDDAVVLVFRLEALTPCGYIDLSTGYETWGIISGIALSDMRVFASPLGANVTPERIVRDCVLTMVDDDHIDFPDASGYTLQHVDFSDPTTVRQAIEDIDRMLDWDYGFEDGQVFFYRKPWTAATVPDGELIVTSYADPNLANWGVRRSFADCYNKVVVHYTKRNGRVGAVTVSRADGPLGATWRTKYVDLTSECDNLTDATTAANLELAATFWPLPTGSIDLTGMAHLAAGVDVPAIYLRPGMMIVNMDEGVRMLVTSVTGHLLDRTITLEVGTRSTKLDRMTARHELGARKKKRTVRGRR